MINFGKIRKLNPKTLVLGSYPIIQSVLDFDYLSGKEEPSIKAIISGSKNFEKYFFGSKEILIPVFKGIDSLTAELREEINLVINLTSGRRCYTTTIEALDKLPNLVGGVVFAEDTPEKLSIEIREKLKNKDVFMVGPSSVGLIIPGLLKIGPIGGVRYNQLVESNLFEQGNVAVLSTSGGMTNELINIVTQNEKRISISLSFGGDKFPITTPMEAFLAAEKDSKTDCIVFFGELGGTEEYELAELVKKGKITKKIIAYIAGTIGDAFDKPTQFGHAKALAQKGEERAVSKRKALADVGVITPNSFQNFVEEVRKIKSPKIIKKNISTEVLDNRKKSQFTTTIFKHAGEENFILGENQIEFAKNQSLAYIVISLFLGKTIKSKKLEEFVNIVLKLLVDHGPHVSGGINTMVTARAGRDMSSSVASGLLTIGDRFGGAINEAAGNFIYAISNNKSPIELVEEFSKQGKTIAGIGHKKYRIDLPDPRVSTIMEFTKSLKKKTFINFAKEIEKITTAKKGNLILNVDGTVAAVLLDFLSELEGYSMDELLRLVDAEFFNSLFVFSRTAGFIAHYLDQKRLDEGLYRLEDTMVAEI